MPIVDTEQLVGLPDAARALGLHRATVNDMVNDGRLPAVRIGSQWFVDQNDLVAFGRSYNPPANAAHRHNTMVKEQRIAAILGTLSEWEDGTADELAQVLHLHVGNVRKYLRLCEADGLAERNRYGSWRLTPAGARKVAGLPESIRSA